MSSNPIQPHPLAFSRPGDWFWAVVKVLAIGLFLVFALIFAAPAFLFVVGIVLIILARRNETQRRVNCWTLSLAMEKRIPMNQTILSLAAESGMLMRARLWQLYCYLESGARFEDAICGVPKVIPRFALPLFRIGCLAGRPKTAMQIICSQEDSEDHQISQTLLGRLFYLTICYGMFLLIMIFLTIKIVPAFTKIGQDFGYVDRLPFMAWLHSICSFCFLEPVALIFSWGLLMLLWLCFYLLLRLIGVVTFDLPGTARFMRPSHRARVQESLALAAECEMPMADALRELAMFYPTWRVRDRLSRVCGRVNSGRDWKAELLEVDLLSKTEYAVVQSAEALGDLPWALRLLATKGRRRILYWAQWLQQILFVVVILAFGFVIFLCGGMMFGFLTQLIHQLA